MSKPVPERAIESRWPVALTIFLALGLTSVLPDRLRLLPIWFLYLEIITIFAAMFAVGWTRGKKRWLRVERVVMLFFCLVMGTATLIGLGELIREIVTGSKAIDGLYLLTSSISLWISNVLIFSLLYWQIDVGGPEARLHNSKQTPDWIFTQASLPEDIMPNWKPTFIDYLFLSFTTATAFSPTDTLPLTQRAKLLMMTESSISLVNIAAIAARAINILGS